MLSDPNVQKFLKDAPEDKRPQLEAVLKKYATRSIAEINTPQVRAQLRKATLDGMKTVYTQEEVNALIGFYSTAVGQSIMDKTPRYLEATVKPMMDILAGKYTQSNESANLRREIRQIMCEGKNPAQACAKQLFQLYRIQALSSHHSVFGLYDTPLYRWLYLYQDY